MKRLEKNFILVSLGIGNKPDESKKKLMVCSKYNSTENRVH